MSDNFLNDFIKREIDVQIEKNNKKIEKIMNEKGNSYCDNCKSLYKEV